MGQINVVIGGCRDYGNYQEFCNFVDDCLLEKSKKTKIVILSGHCSGTDMMAENYAKEKGYELKIFPARWSKYGTAAGPKRNKEMVEMADEVIAFWDYNSAGTKTLIEYAKKLNRNISIKKIKRSN